MTSRARRLLALLALPAVLAACGAGSGAHADERVTIRFWALGAEGEQVQRLVREFERANPGVRVDVQQIPWTAAHEKLLTSYVGDASPDVAQLGNTWIPELVALGALEPLDARVHRSAVIDSSDYFSGIWRTNEVGGHLYGVPWYIDTRVLFYRTDVLHRAGYDSIPDTWAGWRRAMQAERRIMGPKQWPIFLPTNEWTQPVVLGMQAGSPLLKDSAQYGAFSDSAYRNAFKFYLGLFKDDLAPVAGNNDLGNVYQEFARGTIAMWITGPWNIGEMKRRLPPPVQQEWATAPLPGPTGDSSGVSTAGGSSFVLFRGSPHPDVAWRLIEFLSRPEQQLAFYRLTGDLPARPTAWHEGGLVDDRYTHAFWVQLHRVEPTPKVPEWEQIATKVFDYAEQAIRGGVPADTVLARLDRDVDGLLEKRRWLIAHHAEFPTAAGGH